MKRENIIRNRSRNKEIKKPNYNAIHKKRGKQGNYKTIEKKLHIT